MAEDNNFNITPEMINNLANMLKSSNFQNTSDNSSATNQANSILENIDFNQSQDNSNQTNSSSSNSSNFGNIDFETILKIKSIMESLNSKDDPRSNLLYSLKPYLRENRKKKLDQYVNLLKITQVTDLFKNEKGDES